MNQSNVQLSLLAGFAIEVDAATVPTGAQGDVAVEAQMAVREQVAVEQVAVEKQVSVEEPRPAEPRLVEPTVAVGRRQTTWVRSPAGDPAAVAESGFRETSITKICSDLARAFNEIGKVLVKGEVHNYKAHNRLGFFSLKDRGIELSVFIPGSRARFCNVKNGDQVAVAGQLAVVSNRAQVQLVAHEVTPVGAGAIAARIEQTRLALIAEGLIGKNRRRLPLLPRKVGVVCGTDAAVRKDIESVVHARFPGFPIEFCEATVQGTGAVESIAAGIETLLARRVDVIILARGGGDASQLLPFSDGELCRKIAACPVVIVSAIGHQADSPLSDLVADHRAGTPSIAAAMVVPDFAELTARLDVGLGSVGRASRVVADRATARINSYKWSQMLGMRLERESDRLQRCDLGPAVARKLERSHDALSRAELVAPLSPRLLSARTKLDSLNLAIESLSPQRVLERGYSVVRTVDNSAVVRTPSSLQVGQTLEVQGAGGRYSVEVASLLHSGALGGVGDVQLESEK